jgi:hypothetical protein
MTIQKARTILDAKWYSTQNMIDWISYEQFIRDVFESEHILDPFVKLALAAEALGAWTGRGTPTINT